MKRTIGVILLAVIAITLLRRRMSGPVADERPAPVAAATYGTLGGFTTMVANAAGPVMSMYFLASRFPVKEFLGTAAWFFAIVNLAKVPFSIGLGLITGARSAAGPRARARWSWSAHSSAAGSRAGSTRRCSSGW